MRVGEFRYADTILDFEGNQDDFVIFWEHRVRDPRNVVIATVGMLLSVTGGHLPASVFPRGIMRRSESLSALRFYSLSPTGGLIVKMKLKNSLACTLPWNGVCSPSLSLGRKALLRQGF